MEESSIRGELSMCRQPGLKPNFNEIGRRYGLDRHTVARYWNEGGDVDDGRCSRPSGFDAHSALIAEKAAMPGATKKAAHEYLLHRCGGCSYSSVKRDSPFRWAFLAMLTQALPGLRSPPAVRLRTEPCPS